MVNHEDEIQGPNLNIKIIFPGIAIPIKKARQFSDHFNGLVQDGCNSIANASELLQFSTEPSISLVISYLLCHH